MLKCKNCGFNLEEGDVFCPNCGSKQQEESFKDYSSNQTPKSYNQLDFQQIINVSTQMFLKPIDGAKKFIEEGSKQTALILGVVICLIQGFLGIWKTNQIINNISKTIIDFAKSVNSFMSLFNGEYLRDLNDLVDLTQVIDKIKSLIQLPYGKIFLQNAIIMFVIILVVFIGMLIFTNILSKEKSDVLAIFKISVVSLLPFVYFEILSIIASYITFYLGIIILLFGIFASIISLNRLINIYLISNENHSVFITAFISIIALIVFTTITAKYMRTNFMWLINHIKNISNMIDF
ncbi:zinc-ribbon domain-containing protein [Caloramator quimbayensis]|uniref:Zinc-ribbon domain-containing protein n=1 Tax=Caloramator quimbayensis TaxID=1147123 RepID=A0A1T4Y303_9CLOT|nr:zinc-ribbon domain-containing protein [Caloramator quimbayensis]SKA96217.1 zinc-ribbon domain-containing protein [Caloramator quimbayensis]